MKNYIYSLGGLIIFTASQLSWFVVLARFESPESVGTLAISLALASPVFLTLGMNLRVVVAITPVDEPAEYDYFLFQRAAGLVSTSICLALGFLLSLTPTQMSVLACICLAKFMEGQSSLAYGVLQRKGRFEQIFLSQSLRGIAGSAVFTSVIVVGAGLTIAVLAIAATYAVSYFFYDHQRPLVKKFRVGPYAASPFRLLRESWLFGADQGVSSLAVNSPRFLLQVLSGSTSVGLYSAVAAFGQAAALISGAYSMLFLTPLSNEFRTGQRNRMARTLILMMLLPVGLLVTLPIASIFFGDAIVAIVLGGDYVDNSLLTAIVGAFCAGGALRSLSKALEACRALRVYTSVDTITLVTTVGLGVVLVPRWGATGAAVALGLGYGLALGTCLCAVLFILVRMGRS